jgi:tripartite-type tricarboxylate transporter receptor subunit TctC
MLVPTAAVKAQEAFFAGKTLRVIIPAGPGGVYGFYGQVVAPHLSRYIPGHPQIIMQYMPGGGGLVAANHFANIAPKDGTVLAMPHDSLVLYQILRPKDVKYDVRELRWIGTIGGLTSTISHWRTAPAKTVEATKQAKVILGATGRGSYMYMVPRLMNELLGTKYELVTGYKGTADIDIAMERDEVQGRGGNWLSWKSGKQEWMQSGQIVHVVQIGFRKNPELPGVPLLIDLAKSDRERQMFRFVSSIGLIGRSLALPPKVPTERVDVLRLAFAKMIADPAFLADAKAKNIDIEPIDGAEVERAIAELMTTPKAQTDELRTLIGQ